MARAKQKVHWKQLWTLLTIQIKLDMRRSIRPGQKQQRISPVAWNLFFYAIMGSTFALNTVFGSSQIFYTVICLAYAMIMITFTVLLEFGRAMMQPDDLEILLFRPVSAQTYFLSKIGSMLFYVFLLTLAICLIPGWVGAWLGGCSIFYPFQFVFWAILANTMVTFFIVAAYRFSLKIVHHTKFQQMITLFQVLFTFVLIMSYQLIPPLKQYLDSPTLASKSWILALLPPTWFAQSLFWMNQPNLSSSGIYVILSLSSLFILFAIVWRRFSMEFFPVYQSTDSQEVKISKTRKKKDYLSAFVTTLFLRDAESRAGFHVTRQLLKHDFSLRTSIATIFTIPLVFLLLAIVKNELFNPFASQWQMSMTGYGSLSSYFIFFLVFFILRALNFHKDWEASWIYSAAPMARPGRFYRGVKLAVIYRIFAPFFVIFVLVHLIRLPFIHAIKHGVTVFLLSLLAFATASFFIRSYPFSKPHVRGEHMMRIVFLFLAMPVFFLSILFRKLLYNSGPVWYAAQAGLFLVYLLLDKISEMSLKRKLGPYAY